MRCLILVVFCAAIFLFYGCESCEETMEHYRGVYINCIVDSVYLDKSQRAGQTIEVTAIEGDSVNSLWGFELPCLYESAQSGDIIVKEKGSLRFVLKKKNGEQLECYPMCEGKTYYR